MFLPLMAGRKVTVKADALSKLDKTSLPASILAPASYFATEDNSLWRDHVAWPVSHRENRDNGLALVDCFIEELRAANPWARNILLLGGQMVVSTALPWIFLGRAMDSETETAIRLSGRLRQMDYLRGTLSLADLGQDAASWFRPQARPNHLTLRRLARISSWAGQLATPASLLFPQATAISHNPLLRDEARHGDLRVGFRHCEAIYAEALAASVPLDAEECQRVLALSHAFLQRLLQVVSLSEVISRRLAEAFQQMADDILSKAARDLKMMARHRSLPTVIWAGTGGYWSSRLIGLEVMRRGGKVTRFQHGSSPGLLKITSPIALTELSVSTEFVTASGKTAELLRSGDAQKHIAPYNEVSIRGGRGEQHILELARRNQPRKTARRKVLYGPTILCGFRQFVPAILPDPVHLDWQMRLAEKLVEMPVDLVLRPHPEGLLEGRRHPLNDIVPVSQSTYEESMSAADVFVFDYDQSTTFYEALSTDKPVVFIHMGNELFSDAVWEMICRRCWVIHARFDDRNRPQIDMEAFEEAVLNSHYKADGSEFRMILCEA